jgi:hypothetical protein
MDGDTISMLERVGFKMVYEVEYRVRRKWFTEEEAQAWRRTTPFYWVNNPCANALRNEAIALYHKSSRGKNVCLSLADAVRVVHLKKEHFNRLYESGVETADAKPTDCRVVSHWEYFGDVEKQTKEVAWEGGDK